MSEAMKTEQILAELNGLIGDYEKFAQIAVQITWFPVDEQHDDWFRKYPLGIYVNLVKFPKGYVAANFSEAYVRAVLTAIGTENEWDEDFWNISYGERNRRLYSAKAEAHLGSYINFNEIRLKVCTEEHLQKEVNWFANNNGISYEEQEKYLHYVKDAVIIELGGGYSSDYTYLVVKEDTMLLIDCGIWN